MKVYSRVYAYKRTRFVRVTWVKRHTLPVPVARGHYITVKRGRYRDLFLCVIPFVSPLVPTNKEAVTYLTAYYLSSQDFPSCSISLRGNCEKCHFHNFVLYRNFFVFLDNSLYVAIRLLKNSAYSRNCDATCVRCRHTLPPFT